MSSDCLTPLELTALAGGRLDGPALDRAAAHVDACPACLAAVPESDADPVVAALCLDAAMAAGAAAGLAGRYEAVGLHAAGGLGEVHVADDTELGRRVALKRLRPARADDPASRRRFLREAAITARLEHPGVVPVYGLVLDPAGRPHYAMRLVAGESLRDAVRRLHAAGRPDPRALRGLLTRFVTACQTVAYAHSQGVIHRDLKPANVMLGEYGETLVVDWGLAKAVDGRPEPGGGEFAPTPGGTRTGASVGTPGYMSPEQADGRHDDVGPASDIHSLGATLHAILTGTPEVGEGAPPRPLLAVCRKATAAFPEDRYASAAGLGAEVERWLAGDPVTAHRDGPLKRSARWAGRHRVLVACLVVAAAVGGGVGTLGLIEAAERRGDQARLAANDGAAARRALGVVPGLIERWRFAEAVDLLEQTEAGLSDFAPADARGRLGAALADVRLAAALDAVRLAQAELAGESDGPVIDRLPPPSRAAPRYRAVFLARGFDFARGEVRSLARRVGGSAARDALLAGLDDWAFAEPERGLRRRVIRVARAADPGPSWRDEFRAALVDRDRRHLVRLAGRADAARLPPTAAVTLSQALGGTTPEAEELLRAAQPHHPGDFWVNTQLAAAVYALARNPSRAAEAVSYYRAALAVRPGTAALLGDLALALHRRGDSAGAVGAATRAVRRHPASANMRNTLGVALVGAGRAADAEREYREAIRLAPEFALAHSNLARLHKSLGRFARARREYERSLGLDPGDANAHNNLGNLLFEMGDLEGAGRHLRRAAELSPRMAIAHNNLARALRARGDMAGAEAEVRHALRLAPRLAEAHNNLGNLLLDRHDYAAAERAYRRALELAPRHSAATYNVAKALVRRGEFEAALGFARRAVRLFPPGTPSREEAEKRLRYCEEMADLGRKLGDHLRGDAELPAAHKDRLGLVEAAAFRRRYAVVARLIAGLLDDGLPPAPHRYYGVRAAALAGCRVGDDEVGPKARAELRRRALDWLRADLKIHLSALSGDDPQLKQQARGFLRHCRFDPDLARVREEAHLASLPAQERQAWQRLWRRVDDALSAE